MGYVLDAAVGPERVVAAIVEELPHAAAARLPYGLMLIPMTDQLFGAVADGSEPPCGFWTMPGGFDRVLARWSQAGPVAFVHAEYFGGVGRQRTAVWSDGQLSLGPLSVAEHEPFPVAGSPISRALAQLGVPRDGDRDEFDMAGLGRRRDTTDWLS